MRAQRPPTDYRRPGLEQEFYLVDEIGLPSGSADEVLARCREAAGSAGKDPECFAQEVSLCTLERSPPSYSYAGPRGRRAAPDVPIRRDSGRGPSPDADDEDAGPAPYGLSCSGPWIWS